MNFCAAQCFQHRRMVGAGRGGDVAPGQRGVLQYVSPRDFAERLRAPLLAAAAQLGQPLR